MTKHQPSFQHDLLGIDALNRDKYALLHFMARSDEAQPRPEPHRLRRVVVDLVLRRHSNFDRALGFVRQVELTIDFDAPPVADDQRLVWLLAGR